MCIEIVIILMLSDVIRLQGGSHHSDKCQRDRCQDDKSKSWKLLET